jgi:hypothetical protein
MVIDWVRHAESCKNRYRKKNEFKKKLASLIFKHNTDYDSQKKQICNLMKDSILSYSGIHQAIDLGNNFIHNQLFEKIFFSG